MTALSVPDIKLQPAILGSRGSRIIHRLEAENQRKSRMLNTLKQMDLDAPPTSASKRRHSMGSAESVRRSSDPQRKSSNDGATLKPTQRTGRRRSIMIESLQGIGSNPIIRTSRSRSGSIADPESPDNDDVDIGAAATLFPATPFRGRSGRRMSLAPSARLLKAPRTSIEGNLLGGLEESLPLPVSRRRSRRGQRAKSRTGYLSTGQEDLEIQVTNFEELERQKQEKREQTVGKFRSYVRMLICFMRLCESYFLRAADDNMDDYLDDEVQLMFDVRFFKAIKKSDISQDCRKILAKPPHQRSEKELYHALIAMRNYQTFAEYPLTVQQEIVSCGWYARYQAKRVILREGHMPLNFYFILSGSAVVRVVDKSTGISVTVVYLNRGETFGELGIVNEAARQSTVIAREVIELLYISDEDYTRIFMAGGLTKLLEPDHNDFVKNLRFLDGWPMELLAQSPKKCIFSYFKRKDILVKDSKKSDWIIIVKSGSCSVMKLLYKETDKDDPTDAVNGKPLPTIRNATKKSRSRSLSKQRLSVSNLEDFEQRQKREDFEDFLKDLEIEDHLAVIENNMVKKRESTLTSIPEEGTSRTNAGKTTGSVKGKKSNGPQLSRTAYLARKKAHERVFQEVAIIADVKPTDDIGDIKEEDEPSDEDTKTSDDIIMEAPVGKRKTLVDEIMDTDIAADMEEGVEPVWVTVQTLTKGSVFGLAEMMFDDQPSFVVVSNGAECILLSKKFYLEHATMAMLGKIRNEESRFPTEDELKSGLEIKLRWNMYKDAHLQNMLAQKKKHRSKDR